MREEGLTEFLTNLEANIEKDVHDGIATRIERNPTRSAPEGANPEVMEKPITMDEVYDYLDPEDKAILDEFRNTKSLTGPIYKDLMDGSSASYAAHSEVHLSPSESERGLGRDYWKSLGQPGRGVPQGLGTSPFLSTFLTDTCLYELGTDKKALIMYMDDGILFANSKPEMESHIKRLKELLGSMGLEIAPEKSRYVKVEGEWLDSVKFLGLRFLPKENTIMSDTRSGTKVRFPMRADWDDVQLLASLNNSSTYTFKSIYDKLINTTAYEAGLKYGFLGCLIAGSQYKDNKSMEERKEDISRGQSSAWAEILESKGFIWKFQDLHQYKEYLTNVSSIQVHKFMNLNSKGGKLYHYQGRKHRRELLK
jgi:hypothetical protein